MKLNNDTALNKAHIKAIIHEVIRREKCEDIAKDLIVTVGYRSRNNRKQDWCPSGYAYVGTPEMAIKVVKGAKLDSPSFALVIAHEIAHCRGSSHGSMKNNNRYWWIRGWRKIWGWADSYPLEWTLALHKKPVVSKQEGARARYIHCFKMINLWEQKMLVAAKKSAFWFRKAKHLEPPLPLLSGGR